MIAIASCWPPDVATGSGTTVSQNRLLEALSLAGAEATLVYPSRFATSAAGLQARRAANESLRVEGYSAVLGIDGEGWLWASSRPARTVPFVALCEAVLAEVIPFEHGPIVSILKAQAEWESAAAHAADVVVARSSFAADMVAKHYAVPRERIIVLPIPFDIEGWRAALPSLPREPLVLAAGHAYTRKNYGALLRAWPAVVAACPDARLVVVGAGPDSPVLEDLADPLPSVTLLGHVAYLDLQRLYARAHVFCHPSLQENFGIAVVEGLASGAAVVTHTQAAVLESTAGLAGTWALDAERPEALAVGLIEALEAPAPWPASRLDALRQRLSPVRIGQQLVRLLEQLA